MVVAAAIKISRATIVQASVLLIIHGFHQKHVGLQHHSVVTARTRECTAATTLNCGLTEINMKRITSAHQKWSDGGMNGEYIMSGSSKYKKTCIIGCFCSKMVAMFGLKYPSKLLPFEVQYPSNLKIILL